MLLSTCSSKKSLLHCKYASRTKGHYQGKHLSHFTERLNSISRTNRSLVCVGLDPDLKRMPVSDVFEFNRDIIDATKDLVCAYKPNLAFYEALGLNGLKALEKTVAHIKDVASDVAILGDAKRGDIDVSNAKYAEAMFKFWGFDAITVNAFAGGEALESYFEYENKGIFVWCRSSNPGSAEFQDLALSQGDSKMPFYEWMANRAKEWNSRGNVGLVVGATYPDQLKVVRKHCPGMPILIPGVGSQGGDLENSVNFGLDEESPNILINSSRGIIYASSDRADFAERARSAAKNLQDEINRTLEQGDISW